jgi:hypothetical protein
MVVIHLQLRVKLQRNILNFFWRDGNLRDSMRVFLNRRHLVISGLLFSLFLASWLAGVAEAYVGDHEKFVYELTWTGIEAGTATLELMALPNSVKIVSTARSADWVSVFYKVDDRIQTILSRSKESPVVGIPVNYRVQLREGRHRRDKEVMFDLKGHKAVYIDHGTKEKKEVSLKENVLDPLSSFFFVRTLPLEVGKSVFVDMFDSKKVWNVEVQVLRKERIETTIGYRDTIVIKPLMRSEGIFNRKGEMYIWLTDDKKRIPVKMKTKVAVGSVTATLTGGIF